MDWWEYCWEAWRRFLDSWMLMWAPWLMVAGVILLMVASGFWWHEREWSWAAPHATATVTELEARQDAQGNVNYFPHFRFWLPDGTLVQAVSKVGAESPAFDAGDVVPARYFAKDPADATIATIWIVYDVAIVLGVLGTLLFDAGAGFLWWYRRRMRAGEEITVEQQTANSK